ncbi:MAG: ferrous iron transporter B [Chlorobi bacterium CHB2]|nr:ferrous iron transporter B [Chlorobi bacterium CHB2]
MPPTIPRRSAENFLTDFRQLILEMNDLTPDELTEVLPHREHRHHDTGAATFLEKEKTRLVLVGNPNVGKSMFFNHLTGLYVDVSNFPGTTVEVSHGDHPKFAVYDTPGIYGVSSFNDEERVARDIILEGDLILNVVDAVHLERDLFLTLQLIDMGKKIVVCLNMMDEAAARGVSINVKELSDRLGVPVLPTTAIRKAGFERLEEHIAQACVGSSDPWLHRRLHELLNRVGSQAEALMVLEGDAIIAERHGVPPGDERELLYVERRNRVNRLLDKVVTVAEQKRSISATLGRYATSPWLGFPFLAVILYALYLFVVTFITGDVVDFTEGTVGNRMFEPWVKDHVAAWTATEIVVEKVGEDAAGEETTLATRTFNFPEGTDANPALLKQMSDFREGGTNNLRYNFSSPWAVIFFGEFGAFSMTVTYLLFLLLPLVLGFYLSLSLLEDSGYLPRLATFVDRALAMIGLNGRAIIPLILGFGCVTMATITTRLLGTDREKRIATTILQFAIPCSAQLAVIAALLATAGTAATLVYVAVILTVFIAIGTVLDKTLPGTSSPLLLDLPPMRLPRPRNVLQKTWVKTLAFMKEATPWFFIGALAVSVLQVTGLLQRWVDLLAPITTGWLKLPAEASQAFVMGLVRRDFGAAGLYDMALTPMQVVVALTTITLFVPCIASLMVMLKERGTREGLIIWAGSWVVAFGVGGLVALVVI